MWVGDAIYFLSDRNGPMTLFAYDLKSQQVKQILKNDGFDIKSASATADAIVYEQFGSLHLLDLQSGNDRALDIRPVADLAEVRPHFLKIEPKRIRSAEISPTAARAVFGVRGEILTVPAEKGDIRNLTNTTDVVERDPAWSPDAKTLIFPMSPANTRCTSATRAASGKSAKSISAIRRLFIIRRRGRLTPRKSATPTSG